MRVSAILSVAITGILVGPAIASGADVNLPRDDGNLPVLQDRSPGVHGREPVHYAPEPREIQKKPPPAQPRAEPAKITDPPNIDLLRRHGAIGRRDPQQVTTPPSGSSGSGGQNDLVSSLMDLANAFNLTACIPGAVALAADLPPIPADLINEDVIQQVLRQTTLGADQICSWTITGPSGDALTAFLPTWYGWFDSHIDTIKAIIAQYGCSRANGLVQTISDFQTCPAIATAVTGMQTMYPTRPPTAGATTTPNLVGPATTVPATPTSRPPSAATRPDGLVGAAVAAAGVVALVVAAL